MAEVELIRRITVNPAIFGGKPIIRGLRIKVENILGLLEQGLRPEEILAEYPDLEVDDIRACLAYARLLVANESIEAIELEIAK
ncbi:MAG TPA: DUF433 domain-containing protein [Firmicutes bacterium]|jgi:uncharacterized protein (DUF433 family)|nr:DUF433 domain-containing protein [Bacillota bacterium]